MKWIRLWCERLTSPKSGTWAELGDSWELYTKLMCIAGMCEQHGIIAVPGTEMGYSDGQLAAMCRMPQDRFDAQLKHLLSLPDKVKRLTCDRLEMVAWFDFQTPYDKQVEKGYRDRLQPKVTGKGYATEDKKIRSSEEKRTEEGIRTCADDSESSAPVKRLRRKFTEPERKTIDLNCGWFYKRYHQATGQHSPQEPKPGRFPHLMDARAALKLSGLIADRTAPAVDLLLKDWLAGRYYVAVGDTLANFVSILGRLVPANRKDEKVNETPGSERGKHSGSGGFKPLAELLPPAEARA